MTPDGSIKDFLGASGSSMMSGGMGAEGGSLMGYDVNSEGNIILPALGSIKVGGFTANNIIPFIKVGGEIILLLMAITAGRYFNKSRKVAYEMEMMKKEELQAQIDRQIEIYEQESFDDASKNKDKVVD